MKIKGGESTCESHRMTLTTSSPDQSPRILPVPLLSRRQIQGRRPKPTVIIISQPEVSGRHNSPTTAKSVPCSDEPPVMLFLAVHTYRPLSLVEKVWRLSTPLPGCPEATGCPSRCHEKRAGGSESDVQVSRAVWPTNTSPPPTHSFWASLVSTGVSGPSGSAVIRGQRQELFAGKCRKEKPGQVDSNAPIMRFLLKDITSALGPKAPPRAETF